MLSLLWSYREGTSLREYIKQDKFNIVILKLIFITLRSDVITS